MEPRTFSTSPQQSQGTVYLESAYHSPRLLGSASPTISSSGSESPQFSCSATPGEPRQYIATHTYSARPQPVGSGPLPPPHNLTLPPIDSLTMSSTISPHPTPDGPRLSMTSREWVIPPRPKPGRKPATDTPPTKRKAQNRAAQRAFRERRAARVSELEEQLDQQKDTYDKTEEELKEKIHNLELEVQSFSSRCLLLENMLERERKERIRAETEVGSLRRRQNDEYHHHGGSSGPPPTMWSSMQQTHRRSLPDGLISERQDPFPHVATPLAPTNASNVTLTCGNCSPGACACADEVLRSLNQSQDLKRPASPAGPVLSEKRYRTDQEPPSYASRLQHPQHNSESEALSDDIKDGCGFCNEGTYCACADAAMATPALTPSDTLPPISSQTQTPPPSERDSVPPQMAMEMTAEGAVKLPRRNQPRPRPTPSHTVSQGCGANGPGTCAQCQADPKSGLFCRLMAAKLDNGQGGQAEGCCGGKGAGGGCCKTTAAPPRKSSITLPSLPSLGLSCAEAYQTLSSHRNFDKASDDIGSWLPKLRATPTSNERAPNKIMPMEVEAASIMSVLKDFDVRFGSMN